MTPKTHHWDWIQERRISLSLSLSVSPLSLFQSLFFSPPANPSIHTQRDTQKHILSRVPSSNQTCALTIPYSPFQCTCVYYHTEKKHKQKIQAMGSSGTQNSLNIKHPKDNPKNKKKSPNTKCKANQKIFSVFF